MALLVETFDGRFLDGAVHALNLAVRPRVVGFYEAMFDVVRLADHVEAHLTRPSGVSVARLLGELNAVIGQDCVDAVRHGLEQVFEEFQAVRLSALSTSRLTANLLVRSMPTNRYSLPPAVCTSAISMWKEPIG